MCIALWDNSQGKAKKYEAAKKLPFIFDIKVDIKAKRSYNK